MGESNREIEPPVWPAPRTEDRIWTPKGMCIDWCDHEDFCPGPVAPRG